MAAENDAEEVFLVAIKSGDKDKQIVARKVLDEISGAAEESKNILQKIADYSREVGAAAEFAKQREKAVMSATVRRDAESALKKLEKLADTTLKTTNKARVLADIVKKQWLLPVSQPKSSAVSVVEPAK
ncbi:MAG: hypothetical protein PHR77_11605 [Kiritimatiellae bacterium]|nr:hypothetical protein [Kiritimatiellia bacterium]MDD5520917.1 hypothetical protein [Kiritimatiellia bacterium]